MAWWQNVVPATLSRVIKLEATVATFASSFSALQAAVAKLAGKEHDAEAALAVLQTKEIADIGAINKTVADLKAQVAAGTPVTPDQLDALTTQLESASTGLDTVSSGMAALGTDLDTAAQG